MKDVASVIADKAPADVDALMALPYPGTDRTITEVQNDKVLAIGENIHVRRFVRYAEGTNVAYIHMGGKIGVLVNLEVSDNLKGNAAVVELGKDVAMQIAAMNPGYLSSAEVPAEATAKEKEIQLAKALEENEKAAKPKPQQIIEKMVEGRMRNFYAEICLLEQPFVKENKTSVGKHVEAVAKELGGTIVVKAFTRFATGEGIEKKEENFADEVASMIK